METFFISQGLHKKQVAGFGPPAVPHHLFKNNMFNEHEPSVIYTTTLPKSEDRFQTTLGLFFPRLGSCQDCS